MVWAGELVAVLLALRASAGPGWMRSSPAIGVVTRLWGTFLILSFNLVMLNALVGWESRWYKPAWGTLSTFYLASLAWLLLSLPYLTDAGVDFYAWLIIAGGFVVIGGGWTLFFVLRLLTLRAPSAWWLVPPLALAAGYAIGTTDAGLALRLALCEPRLRAYAEAVPPGDAVAHEPERVGLFSVDEAWEHEGAVYLFTSWGFLNRHGVAYNPDGARPPERIRTHHLFGPWYQFTWGF